MIWNTLGFSRDIFFVEALEPNKDEMELFVGRKSQVEKFLVDCLAGERSLKIVSGQLGVGKTTFVNACQYYSSTTKIPGSALKPDKVLLCYPKIQIHNDDTVDSTIQKVISSVCHSIVKYAGRSPGGEVAEMVNYFTKMTLSTGGTQFQAQGSFAGTGGGMGIKTPNFQYRDQVTWRPQFEKLVEFITRHCGFKGVFVVINNLEIATKAKIAEVLNPLRDALFDLRGLYFVLIGYTGISSTIISEVPRVRDYLSGTETVVEPMEFEEIQEIIAKRVEKFRIPRGNGVNPLPDDSVALFHYLSLREARSTLRICSEVVKKSVLKYGIQKKITYQQAMECFIEYCGDEARQLDLTENNRRILDAIFDASNTVARPKDFEKFGYATNAGFHAALKSLTAKGLLQVLNGASKARYYLPTGMTMLAGLSGALGDTIKAITARMVVDQEEARRAMRPKLVIDPSQYSLFAEEDETEGAPT